ncbi:MAG: ArdC family protein [Thermoleophilia bacterium]
MQTVLDTLAPAAEPEKRDRADDALQAVLAMFDDPDQLAQNVAIATIAGILAPDAPCRAWSLGNRLLMLKAGTHDARGFRQWQHVGRKVRKGGRAFWILAPKLVQKKETDATTGEETKRPILVGFTAVAVFGYDQTEGDSIGYEENFNPDELPPLADVAARLGVTVTYVPTAATLGQNALGWYAHASQSIVLGVHDPAVYLHELAHAAHYATGRAKPGTDTARKEVVAELTAAVVSKMYGLPVQRRTLDYLASYSQGGDVKKAAMAVLADVDAVLSVLFPRTTEETAA